MDRSTEKYSMHTHLKKGSLKPVKPMKKNNMLCALILIKDLLLLLIFK